MLESARRGPINNKLYPVLWYKYIKSGHFCGDKITKFQYTTFTAISTCFPFLDSEMYV